jgi:CheY-like chemotaxis protein
MAAGNRSRRFVFASVVKILVAESSRLFHLAWERLIRDFGQEPVFATTGSEAIRRALESHCHTGLIAHTLPDMDGETCLSRIQQLAAVPLYRPVVVTSNPDAWSTALMREPLWEVADRQDLPSIRRILEDRIRDCILLPLLPVLYLDDSQVAAKHMQALLAKIGVTLHHFATPDEALHALEETAYELVLCDVQIEDAGTGYDLVPKIRQAILARERPPVILVSANDSEDQRQLAFLAGADDFWSKSVSIGVVQKYLERYREMRLLRMRVHQLEQKMLAERFLDPESGLPNEKAFRSYANWRLRTGFTESSLIRVVVAYLSGPDHAGRGTPTVLDSPEFRKWKSGLPQSVFCTLLPSDRLILIMPTLSADTSAEESPWSGLPPLPRSVVPAGTPDDVTSFTLPAGSRLEAVWQNLRLEHETVG